MLVKLAGDFGKYKAGDSIEANETLHEHLLAKGLIHIEVKKPSKRKGSK
jgi:hypothetical protein